jgi:lipopolysaccharide transport system permease protein
LGLGVQVASIGIIFGLLFGAELAVFLPFLATSLVLWNFLVTSINESTEAYLRSQQIIKQMRVPSFFPVVRVVAKNLIVFAHNLVIIVVVGVIFGIQPGWTLVLFIPGLLLVAGVIYSVSSIAAIVSARFRDVPPIVSSVLMVSFYLTPVISMPETLPETVRNIVLTWNPFYHLMELIRGPIIGQPPSVLNWLVGVGVLVITGLVAQWASRKYFWKVVYWL